MNDILSEYFKLNSSKSKEKGNGVAIFCAIVSIVACSYSLNLASNQQGHLTQSQRVIGRTLEIAPKSSSGSDEASTIPASHQQ